MREELCGPAQDACAHEAGASIVVAQVRNDTPERTTGALTPHWQRCDFCKRSYTSLAALRRHLRQCRAREPEEATFSCRQCGVKFQSMTALQKHEKTHTSKSIRCTQCGILAGPALTISAAPFLTPNARFRSWTMWRTKQRTLLLGHDARHADTLLRPSRH